MEVTTHIYKVGEILCVCDGKRSDHLTSLEGRTSGLERTIYRVDGHNMPSDHFNYLSGLK